LSFVTSNPFERGKGPTLLISIGLILIAYIGIDQLRRWWHVSNLPVHLSCDGYCEFGRKSDYSQYPLIFYDDTRNATDVCFELADKAERLVKDRPDFVGAEVYSYETFEDCVASQRG